MARIKLIALLLLLTLPLYGFNCRNPFGEDPVAPPPPPLTLDDFLFNVHIEAAYAGGVPGTNGFVKVACAPAQNPSCNGSCLYDLEVDGISIGSTFFGTTFVIGPLPSNEVEYTFQCIHRPSASDSIIAYVLVP